MAISKGFEYHAFVTLRNDGMKQKESTLISTVTIGCGWTKQVVSRHLVLRGNPPYVTSAKTVRIEREPAEATAGVDLRCVLDGHACAENKGVRKHEHSNNNGM
jgi:hypothetical protein